MRLNFRLAATTARLMLPTLLILTGPVASASDNILFDRASWEFEGAESIEVRQVKERMAVDLVCAIAYPAQGILYSGFIGSIRAGGDEVIGGYLLVTIETADFARRTITVIDNPEGDAYSSDRMLTMRRLPRSGSLIFRLNESYGEAHEYCWEVHPIAAPKKPEESGPSELPWHSR